MKHTNTFFFLLIAVVLGGCATATGPSVIGNPQYAFVLKSSTHTRGLARDVWVDGILAYVADDEYGVTIWDVSNRAAPVMIDSIPTYGKVQEVAYSSETGLIITMQGSSLGGIPVYDLATKAPQFSHGNGRSNAFRFKAISPDTLILAEVEPDNDGCQFLLSFKDINFTPIWSSDLHAPYAPAYGTLYSLELDSNYVYFAHGQYGVSIIEYDFTKIGPGFTVTELGRVETPGLAQDLILSKDRNHLFVADNQTGLQVVDISDKMHPRIVGNCLPPNVNDAIRVHAIGDTAIFIEQYRGIYAVDCTNPRSPNYFGTFACNDPQGIFIGPDKTVYLADLDQGLVILEFRQ